MVEGPKVAIGIEAGRVIRRMGLVEAVEIDEATRDGEKALELAEAASAYKMASPG